MANFGLFSRFTFYRKTTQWHFIFWLLFLHTHAQKKGPHVDCSTAAGSYLSSLTHFLTYLCVVAMQMQCSALPQIELHHPEDSASSLSRLFLTWTIPLFRKGAKAPLVSTDLPPLPTSASIAAARDNLGALRTKRPKEPLLFSLARLVKRDIIISALTMLLYLAALLANPLLLRELVNSLTRGSMNEAVGYSLALGIAAFIAALSNAHTLLLSTRMAHQLRVAVVTTVFRKALKAPAPTVVLVDVRDDDPSLDACAPRRAKPDASALLASDAERFVTAMPLLHNAWGAPLLIIVSTYFLIAFLGPGALAGVAVLLLSLPINTAVLRCTATARKAQAASADTRVRETADALAGITAIKLAAGEAALATRLLAARVIEVQAIRRANLLFAVTTAISISTSVVAMVAMFAAFTATGRVHSAGNTFAALSLFNVIRFPLQNLGMLFATLSQLFISVGRIETFLDEEEEEKLLKRDSDKMSIVTEDEVNEIKLINDAVVVESPIIIDLSLATFIWPRAAADTGKGGSDSLRQLILGPISLRLKDGEMLCVVGSVGSGKSSFLLALLGEMPRGLTPLESASQDQFSLHGTAGIAKGTRIGFAPQTPWLLNGSLRKNVVFGGIWDLSVYVSVLRACALWPDIADFGPQRDLSVIGERGVTLSGGQRARVGLARAAYMLLANNSGEGCKRGLLLVDDALAALDTSTGALIWHRLLGPTGLLAQSGIARVIVTHSKYYLAADSVLALVEGKSVFFGPPKAIPAAAEKASGDVSTFLLSLAADVLVSKVDVNGVDSNAIGVKINVNKYDVDSNQIDETIAIGVEEAPATAEDRATGSVSWSVFSAWALEGKRGQFYVIALFFAFLIERVSYVGSDIWLSSWTAAASPISPRSGLALLASASGNGGGDVPTSLTFWLPFYVVFGAANVVGSFGRMILVSTIATGASARLFDRALWAVLRSPPRFFDVTPLGRILSRLSFDVDVLDSKILSAVAHMLASTAWLISACVVMIAVVPWSALALGPGLVAYFVFNSWVRPTLRELQRLDSLSRSPLAASVTESLRGSALLRSAGAVPRYITLTDTLLEKNAEAGLCFQDSTRAMALVLDIGGAILITVIALLGIAAGSELPAALVGLAINWAQNFTISLNFHLVNTTAAEASGVAVERLLTYSSLPAEAPLVLCVGANGEKNQQTTLTLARARAEIAVACAATNAMTWPHVGSVVFDNVSVRYGKGLPLALDGVSFAVPAGSFVAVVGRSGSGKSTLAAAIFRIVESEVTGSILIDGDNIANLGLSQLRGARAVIIPQEPSVFRGSLRINVDPNSTSDDASVWAALKGVGLDGLFPSGGKIDVAVALMAPLDPSTLSMGQRQLLCLARALLRRPTLLVLDEATASVDPSTDEAIMNHVARVRALGTTVICIAHRLDAAVRADAVLVIEKGRVAEYGSPSDLLKRIDGAFTTLVKAAGPEREAILRAEALTQRHSSSGGRDLKD